MEQRREHFRLAYPLTHRPPFVSNGKEYPVSDISEHGICFEVRDNDVFELGQEVDGTLRFPDGEGLTLRGSVARLEHSAVAIHLLTPIPLTKIRSEELRLLRKYPGYRS